MLVSPTLCSLLLSLLVEELPNKRGWMPMRSRMSADSHDCNKRAATNAEADIHMLHIVVVLTWCVVSPVTTLEAGIVAM